MALNVEALKDIPEGTFKFCTGGKYFTVSGLEDGGSLDIAQFEREALEVACVTKSSDTADVKFEVLKDIMYVFPAGIRHDDYFWYLNALPDDLLSAGLFRYAIKEQKIMGRRIDPYSQGLDNLLGNVFTERSWNYANDTILSIFGNSYKLWE